MQTFDRCCTRKPAKDFSIREERDGFTRIAEFQPGFVCEKSGGGSHGIHGMTVRFILLKDHRATAFSLNDCDWLPQEASMDIPPRESKSAFGPMAWDLGYHSPTPMYGGQTAMESCDLTGGECYCDGSALNAIPVMAAFFSDGPEAVWKKLREMWAVYFEKEQGHECNG